MNRKSIVIFISALLCVTLAGSVAAQSDQPNAVEAAVPAAFTYQGQIKRNGALFTGACNMQFKLWDAAAGGLQQGAMLPVNGVSVDNGVFAVELNFGNHFTGQARWVEAAAKCGNDSGFTTLPRVALNATPYAIGLMPGATINGDIPYAYGNATFKATNASASGGTAMFGHATATSGNTAGVFGLSGSPAGAGIWGRNNGGAGVLGESSSFTGVWGKSTTGTGVVGESTAWAGVYGISANQAGVWGKSTSASGVYGESSTFFGVWGKSTTGSGVVGESTAWAGVYGASTDQAGVWGKSTNATGVYGESTSGYAGWFNGRTKTQVLEITGGSDLAELFEVGEGPANPGTLMIIDAAEPGHLTISTQAYDTKVAGIVSGAGGVQPGLTLQQEGVMEGDTEVAIAGRVYVKATAINGAIQPGDLLTTSDLPGHAMKATDRERSPGAIIGKAMTGLDAGEGLVLVLVNLQ
ncbi:MAG TPA: hypothetical protein VJG32_08480 [Anaerolineae bacterium]|nr:hypothetical protein [Anaerolineae bacterium]